MTAEPLQHTAHKYAVGVPATSERSMQRQVYGVRKYPSTSALLASSAGTCSILSEITIEKAGSRMYAETAALTLAARLLQKYCDCGSSTLTTRDAPPLDHVRLRRVLDYISTNIDTDITLADLARVADQSPFHFARKFALVMGVPPKRYVSRMRLDKAMAELAAGKLPLAQIALNAGFSSQTSFTRAFRRTTSMTPQE